MIQPCQQSSQGSGEKSPSSHSKQLLHHVLKDVVKINQDGRVSFSKWIDYNDYHNIHKLCDDLHFELENIHDYSDYIVNGQHCALKFATMNKIKLFISWMSTRKKTHVNFLLSIFFPLHIRISISSGKKT